MTKLMHMLTLAIVLLMSTMSGVSALTAASDVSAPSDAPADAPYWQYLDVQDGDILWKYAKEILTGRGLTGKYTEADVMKVVFNRPENATANLFNLEKQPDGTYLPTLIAGTRVFLPVKTAAGLMPGESATVAQFVTVADFQAYSKALDDGLVKKFGDLTVLINQNKTAIDTNTTGIAANAANIEGVRSGLEFQAGRISDANRNLTELQGEVGENGAAINLLWKAVGVAAVLVLVLLTAAAWNASRIRKVAAKAKQTDDGLKVVRDAQLGHGDHLQAVIADVDALKKAQLQTQSKVASVATRQDNLERDLSGVDFDEAWTSKDVLRNKIPAGHNLNLPVTSSDGSKQWTLSIEPLGDDLFQIHGITRRKGQDAPIAPVNAENVASTIRKAGRQGRFFQQPLAIAKQA